MRSSSRYLRSVRAARPLLVAAVTAAAVLAPATAWAADTPAPGDPVTTTVDGAADALTGTTGSEPAKEGADSGTLAGQQATGSGPRPQASSTAGSGSNTPPAASPSQSAEDLPPIDLSQLNALLAQAGISESCATSVEADLQQTVEDIPATAEQLLQAILDELDQGDLPSSPLALTDPENGAKVLMKASATSPDLPVLSSSDPSELLLVQDLQQLLTDLLTKCLPAPPTVTPPSSTSPAPVAAQPVSAQPVTYLGYAPTGGTGPAPAQESDGPGPLAALGAGLVLTGGAGVAWYRVRSRAARAQD